MTLAPEDRRYPSFGRGDRLRKARTLLGADMDVRAFAELLGVSKNTVTNYELERTPPEKMRPVVLMAWALATGVDVDWIRTGVRPAPDPVPGGGRAFVMIDALETPRSYVSSRIHDSRGPVRRVFAA